MKNKLKGMNGKNAVKNIIMVYCIIVLLVISKLLLKDDFISFFKWWLVLLLMGVSFLPLSKNIFFLFFDSGYLFSKTIGLAISGYLMWLLSSIKVIKFSSFSCVLIALFCLVINGIIYILTKDKLRKFKTDNWSIIIFEELLFLAVLLIWTYIRGFKPEAYGTEKFMDYGFMTAMMRADYMPPKDMWFAGGNINYYYVGQFMAVFLTKLSFIKVNLGYNLMLMTLAAFGFVLPFTIIFNVTKHFFVEKEIKVKSAPYIAGILSGAGVSLAGNMHFTLFYWVIPRIRSLLSIEGDYENYWFPSSTRYIGYNPETNDKTIHEFPSYSFVLGDLHAHVLNIIFVLTVTGILFAWLLYKKQQWGKNRSLQYKKQEDL